MVGRKRKRDEKDKLKERLCWRGEVRNAWVVNYAENRKVVGTLLFIAADVVAVEVAFRQRMLDVLLRAANGRSN